MSPETRRTFGQSLWRQLPFFVWLIVVWMLLWGEFSAFSLVSGVIVAFVVTRIFLLPPVELSGRVNVWYLAVLAVTFSVAVVAGSLHVTLQVLNPRRYPGTAIIGVQLETDDDLIMTHVGVTASLIPGSLVVQTDRTNRILYLHVLDIDDEESLRKAKAEVRRWERRIVRAVGSRDQMDALRRAEAKA
ncbi:MULTISPECIES: Na+/H+ antiporter subunit E [Microbacterium]|jgi:multicomponent Na+:H+ antiporter subunit E|uniref:Na+/H+ antiporter subunit E n=1 Tax=Microbacterium TaxID=33882 RepID=UPI001E358FDB|nr:Na+/H+ antiporter subunit E [Microbacterium nymphoidis]MCD2498320.1 Na+/H+ antiporter subunit E [Microbacterium nymphoidis]